MSGDTDDNTSLTSLNSITEGAGLFLIGKGIYQIIEFITNLLLTRTLGASLYGIYAYLRVIFSLLRVLTRLGGDKAMLRFLPEYKDNVAKRQTILTLAYATSIITSSIVAIAVYILAPIISQYTLQNPLFVDVLRVAALVLPFNTLSNITFSAFKGLERMDYNVAISSVVQPVFRLIFVGGAVLLGYSVIGAAAGLVVSGFIIFLIAILVLYRKTEFTAIRQPSADDAREYYDFSFPLILSELGNFLYNRVDLLMVGFLLTGATVGIYNVAVLVAGTLALPLTAFNQLFPPIASRLYNNQEWTELENVYSTVTRWIFTISLFPGLATILYANEILQVFGEGFSRGTYVLILFVIAQLTSCVVGPSGFLLMMTENHYLAMFNQLSSGLLNVVLNYVFITKFGFIGAAAATATVLAGINILRVIQVWYLHGISPYNRQYYKPILAGLISSIVMYMMSMVLNSYALIISGGILGGMAFVVLLYSFGLEDEELDIIRNLLPN